MLNMITVFPVPEGEIVIQFPKSLSQESFNDLKDLAGIIMRQAKRNIIPKDTLFEALLNKPRHNS